MFKAAKAIIRYENSFFLQLRDNVSSIPYPNFWAFFGGRLLKNEEPKDGLVREIKEELNITVLPTKLLKNIKHTYSHFSVNITAYSCKYIKGQPEPIGCSAWRWISPDKIYDFPFPKANHKLFNKIIGSH